MLLSFGKVSISTDVHGPKYVLFKILSFLIANCFFPLQF